MERFERSALRALRRVPVLDVFGDDNLDEVQQLACLSDVIQRTLGVSVPLDVLRELTEQPLLRHFVARDTKDESSSVCFVSSASCASRCFWIDSASASTADASLYVASARASAAFA